MMHIVITPVFNEERHLAVFLDSIIHQTLPPDALLLVDDNSTDSSAYIIKKYCQNHDFISYIYHSSAPEKVQGSKVINAFNYGIQHTNFENVEYISKIDADIDLPKEYFENVLKVFYMNPQIGIAGGRIMEFQKGKWAKIAHPALLTRGALKTYRKSCFFDIGGLIPVLGWDGLDTMKALYKGWQTTTVDSNVRHLRAASQDYCPVKMHYEIGIAHYKIGRSLLLALARAAISTKYKPLLILGISYFTGYFISFIKREKKIINPDLARFINNFHKKRLFNLSRYYDPKKYN
jgi:glycosyltransferase involved in cell wall biosynthesis